MPALAALRELLIFALMGFLGGLLGALIVPMNEVVRIQEMVLCLLHALDAPFLPALGNACWQCALCRATLAAFPFKMCLCLQPVDRACASSIALIAQLFRIRRRFVPRTKPFRWVATVPQELGFDLMVC